MKKIIFLTLITFISCSNESDTLNESVQLNANEQEGDVLNNNKLCARSTVRLTNLNNK